jgi:hypothetical protein
MPKHRTIPYEPCQRLHHSWYEGTDPGWVPAFGLIGEVQICDNCGTVTQYLWPDGYHMARDERPSKQEMRAEWFERERKKQRRKGLKAVS